MTASVGKFCLKLLPVPSESLRLCLRLVGLVPRLIRRRSDRERLHLRFGESSSQLISLADCDAKCGTNLLCTRLAPAHLLSRARRALGQLEARSECCGVGLHRAADPLDHRRRFG